MPLFKNAVSMKDREDSAAFSAAVSIPRRPQVPLSKGAGDHPATSTGPRQLGTVVCSFLVVAVVALLWEVLVVAAGCNSSEPEGEIGMCQEEGFVWREFVLDAAYRRALGVTNVVIFLLCCIGKLVADSKLAHVVRRKLREKLEDSFDRPSTVGHAWTRLGWQTRVGVGVVTVSNVSRCCFQPPSWGTGGGGGGGATAAVVAEEKKEADLSEADEISSVPDSTTPKLLTVRGWRCYLY